jgi:hypothetical protein
MGNPAHEGYPMRDKLSALGGALLAVVGAAPN